MAIHAYAALAARATLSPFEYQPGELRPTEVCIDITHCGLCYSDIHLLDGDFGPGLFPLVPGHEIIGTVREVGSAVRHLKAGQRVGVGPQRDACLHCQLCMGGQESLCSQKQLTIVGHHGGFASAIQLDAAFAFPIPEALPSETAAPLLCAGLTVYTPLVRYTRPEMRVGIMGIGGLGHLAIQFARKLGNEVTVFSSSASKEEEALRLGAHRFVNTRSPEALKQAANTVDFILSTSHGDAPWGPYVEALRADGRLCIVGASSAPLNLSLAELLIHQKTVSGSAAGGRKMMADMLDFSARHGITAWTEVMPMSQVNEAVARVRRGEARYRVVLRNEARG